MATPEKAPGPAAPEVKKGPDLRVVVDNTKPAAEGKPAARVVAPDLRSFFERAKDKITSGLSSGLDRLHHTRIGDAAHALERAGVRWGLKSFQVARFERNHQFAHEKSVKAEMYYVAQKKMVEVAEQELASLDKKLEEARSFTLEGESLTPRRAAALVVALEREQAVQMAKIKSAKKGQDKWAGRLHGHNDTKAHWENRQKTITEQITRSTQELSSPYRERINTLNGEHQRITKSMEKPAQKIKESDEKIAKLEAAMNASPSKGMRGELKRKIAELKSNRMETQGEYDTLKNKHLRVERKLGKANARLRRWDVVENEFNRRTHHGHEPVKPEFKKVKPNLERRGYSFDIPAPEEEAEEENKGPEEQPKVQEAEAEVPEKEKNYENIDISPAEYIELWNKKFGTRYPPNLFDNDPGKRVNSRQKYPVLQIEKAMQAFFRVARAQGKVRNSEAQLKKNFDEILDTIVEQNQP